MRQRRVCITGIGIVSPLGNSREETWTRVLAAQSGAAPISQFPAATWPTTFACEVKNFSLREEMVDAYLVNYLNRPAQFGIAAAHEAVVDSQIMDKIDPELFGVSVGANIGAISPISLYQMTQRNSCLEETLKSKNDESYKVLRNHPGTLAAVLSAKWRLLGPSATIHTACASSGQSLGLAYRMIKRGECDAMVTGGADSLAAELLLAGFCLLGALSTRNYDPQGASRPFDKERDGFVAGEGAAMIVLEDLEHALRRGAKIYAEIVGYGETESAYRITDLPPNGRGIVEAMHCAVEEANLNHADIHYINAHGTSTEVNDRIEALAVRRVFGERGSRPMISSTKSETGHLISAAGALELSFCALALRDGRIPPTRNLHQTDCGDDLDFVANVARSEKIKAAMSNSIGFGGSNSSIIVRTIEAG